WPWSASNTALGTPVKTWSCPMDGRQLVAQDEGGYKVAFTGLLAVRGTMQKLNDGVICNKKVAMAGISDGTSNTLMIGARPPSGGDGNETTFRHRLRGGRADRPGRVRVRRAGAGDEGQGPQGERPEGHRQGPDGAEEGPAPLGGQGWATAAGRAVGPGRGAAG